ncbi:hypothetical protein [Aquimarina agarilytica]|uniref:hypothetical protein n=1 Tax=Aquimarina agarilytica TaxID=1087449 RepID=UPI00030D59EB|nr:hypothetical protein [Aquimarina agarilytica]
MRTRMLTLLGFLTFCILSAQDSKPLVEDQNPNYKVAMDKYMESPKEYTLLQSTTVQETYKAIDPLEEKRELRSQRRQFSAQRPYWRHQRRLERIKNTRYYESYDNGFFNNRGFYNYGYRNNNFIGRNQRFRNYNYLGLGGGLLGLGLLGSCLID